MSDSYVIETDLGTITVPGSVLSQLVVRAAEGVGGARVRRPRRGVDVEVQQGWMRVSVELAVRLGLVVPDVARQVQEQVRDSLRTACGLEEATVDVAVEELRV
jgi:uncharacterized alkaline shock family protein YloU